MKLKPCPKCRGDATTGLQVYHIGKYKHRAKCRSCGLMINRWFPTVDEAIEEWNSIQSIDLQKAVELINGLKYDLQRFSDEYINCFDDVEYDFVNTQISKIEQFLNEQGETNE